MPTVEEIVDVSATEERGRVVLLKRVMKVSGLTVTNQIGALEEALQAAPAYGTAVGINGSVVYLQTRNPKIRQGSDIADVELVYKAGNFSGGSNTGLTTRGGTSLKQVTTDKDRNGNAITVEHTWPADDPNFPNETHTQGGSITVMKPMSTYIEEYELATDDPISVTRGRVGYVNSNNVNGGAKRTWMCTSGDYDPIDETLSPPLYKFTFIYEYDKATWDDETTAVFIDPRTGKRPPDIQAGTVKKIEYPEGIPF